MSDGITESFKLEVVTEKPSNVDLHLEKIDDDNDYNEETALVVPYLAPPQRAMFVSSNAFLSPVGASAVALSNNNEKNIISESSKHCGGSDNDNNLLKKGIKRTRPTAEDEDDDDKTFLQVNLEALFKNSPETASPIATASVCSYLLRNYFGVATGQFRTGQQEVVLSILQKRNTLAIFPTGWGKTMCFQFPILVHRLLFAAQLRTWQAAARQPEGKDGKAKAEKPPEARFAIVISPLLSLMTEQAGRIANEGNLRTALFSSGTTQSREKEILNELSSPLCSIDLVFVSPERLVRGIELRDVLRKNLHRIAFICVDEVHCVSQWAYDFRPSFMYVHRVFESFAGSDNAVDRNRNMPPFLCLTATAAPSVINDLKAIFRIEQTVKVPYCRDNICLESVPLVEPGSSRPPTQHMIQEKLLQAVLELPKPMLVYVQTRVDANELATFLVSKLSAAQATKQAGGHNCATSSSAASSSSSIFTSSTHAQLKQNGGFGGAKENCISIRSYHAALERHVRTKTQQEFMRGNIDVLIATVAFGMGIDKANIRTVVHASAPSSLESYVQETGRSGRDGEKAVCRLLYNPFDFYTLRSRLLASYLSQAEMLSIVQHILDNPTTHIGEKVMLVSVSRISEELVMSEETVETVLFMLLLHEGGLLHELVGTAPVGYTVTRAAAEVVVSSEENFTGSKRRRGATKSSGVSGFLAQLDVLDGVFELCRQSKRIDNVVTAANALKLSLHDFQFRLNDLVAGGFVSLRQQSTAYVVSLGDQFAELSAVSNKWNTVAERLWRMHHIRHEAMLKALEKTFSVLHHPTHDAVLWGLEWDGDEKTLASGPLQKWQPPPRSLTKVEAVSIANDFVAKNRSRIRSTHEAARALLGVFPKPIASHGKFASELPLTVSWYVGSPYFGLLREFELQWLLKVLLPHGLDGAQLTDNDGRLPTV